MNDTILLNEDLVIRAHDDEPTPAVHVLIPVIREYTGEVVYARIGRTRWAQLFELGSGPKEGTRGAQTDLDNYYGDNGHYIISQDLRVVYSTGEIVKVTG